MPERGATAEPPLLERDAELERIEDAFKAATGGAGSLIVVEGHAGVGKTRLLDEARTRANALGLSVLSARGAETEQDFSFGVVLQLLQRRVMSANAAERSEVFSGAAAVARPLLDGSKLGISGRPEAAPALSHGLYWVISNLADREPLALVVDDAHWADTSSLRFLASLANRLEGLPVAVLLARRLGETTDAAESLDAIARSAGASEIAVPPLSDEAISTLVRATYAGEADDRFCEACVHAVAGNPLYLQELLAGLRLREIPANADGAHEVLSMDLAGIRRSVRGRLSRAGGDATILAEVASLDDGGLALDRAAYLARVARSDAEVAVASLTAADVLVADEPLRFAHPLVRKAVYTALPDIRRRSLHRDLAKMLHDAGEEAERVAVHLHLGEQRHEEWAVDALIQAAAHAFERGVPNIAASHLRLALDENSSPETRPRILAELGLAEVAAGNPEAGDLVREAAVSSNTASQQARYLLVAALTMFQTGRYEDAIELVRGAARLEPEDPATRIELAGFIAGFSNILGVLDTRTIEELAGICDILAGQPDAPSDDAQHLMFAAYAGRLSQNGDRPAGFVHMLATRALAGVPGDKINGAMFAAPMALWLTDDFDHAARALSASAEAALGRGMLHNLTSALTHRSEIYYRQGNVRAAIADAEIGIGGASQGFHGVDPVAYAILTLALADVGDVPAAERALDGLDLSAWAGLTHLALLYEARGHLMLLRGRSRDALRDFEAAGRIVETAQAANPSFCAWRSGAALAHHALGERDRALGLAGEEVTLAKTFGAARATGIALRAQGLVAGSDDGTSLLQEAVDVLAGSAARLEYARALVDLGAALRRVGSRSAARDYLRLGLDVASSCGANGLATRARDELIAAGGRPRRERLTGLEALTPQERRVAELALQGLSNREIAQALFLTRKTVETHLTSVYGKLSIHSREELAGHLDRTKPT